MSRMLPLELAVLLQLQLWSAFSDADIGPVVSLPAVLAFKPNKFSFTFLSHATLLYRPLFRSLTDNFGYNAGADGSAAFTNSEPQAFFHRDGRYNLDFHSDVIAGHTHLSRLAFSALNELD